LGTLTHPIINTAIIGAFAQIMDIPLNIITDVIKNDIPAKIQQNIEAAKYAYKNINYFAKVKKGE
jgi:Pyruvate/2-oxoacid:ferredoxin oxidoreductase gamma subunit